MPYKDPVRRKEYHASYNSTYNEKYYKNLNQYIIDYISSGDIIDRRIWDLRCNQIKRSAKKYPYSEDFTNDAMFEMMVQGCFFCGDIATTIDRRDSTLDHTLENCVGCCHSCNVSKGSADPSTFIRKAYYRSRGYYFDDDVNIWFSHKTKPRVDMYKRDAKKKGVAFELTNEEFDILIKSDCEYCKRSPLTWFGIDRVIPSLGYVIGNVVSCCWDCNRDKLGDDVETMSMRNNKISVRVDAGELVLDDYEKVVLHTGVKKNSKKVCAYGKVYASKLEASRALGKCVSYVAMCIKNGSHPNDIFEISDSRM